MVDHRELFEDVIEALARAGFDTASGASPLSVDRHPEGVAVGWSPGPEADGPPSGPARAAVSGAAALVLRERGFLVTETEDGELLVCCAEPVTAPPGPEPGTAPEQWWG